MVHRVLRYSPAKMAVQFRLPKISQDTCVPVRGVLRGPGSFCEWSCETAGVNYR